MKSEIGFIGVGAMGGKLVARLLRLGHAVYVCDTSSDAVAAAVMLGAARCETPRHVADHAEVVFTCLPTPQDVERVTVGPAALWDGTRVKVVANHSATGPAMARVLASQLAQRDIVLLDAPLTGGVAAAAAGTLGVIISGDPLASARCVPVVRAYAQEVVHIGDEPGMSQTLNLVNSMIVGSTLVATAEALLMGIRSGLGVDVLLSALQAATAHAAPLEILMAHALHRRRFDSGVRTDAMRQSLKLFLAEAEAVGSPALICGLVKQLFDQSISQGHGKQDMTHVVRALERLAAAEPTT